MRHISVELDWAGNTVKGFAEYTIRDDRNGSVDLDVVEVKSIDGIAVPPRIYLQAAEMSEHDYDRVIEQIHTYHREYAAGAYDYTREEA